IQLAHHHIGRMRHDRTENTGQVATRERDGGLCALVVVGFVARETGVDHLDDGLEGGKFHHRVGDLSAPERVQAFVKTVKYIYIYQSLRHSRERREMETPPETP